MLRFDRICWHYRSIDIQVNNQLRLCHCSITNEGLLFAKKRQLSALKNPCRIPMSCSFNHTLSLPYMNLHISISSDLSAQKSYMSVTVKQIGQVSAQLKSQIEQFQQHVDQNDTYISQLKDHVRTLCLLPLWLVFSFSSWNRMLNWNLYLPRYLLDNQTQTESRTH